MKTRKGQEEDKARKKLEKPRRLKALFWTNFEKQKQKPKLAQNRRKPHKTLDMNPIQFL